MGSPYGGVAGGRLKTLPQVCVAAPHTLIRFQTA
ncbi:hypothetical protein J2T38_000721 [Neisseria perflava]|nr:hypothetical protein [Neisseria perflava]